MTKENDETPSGSGGDNSRLPPAKSAAAWKERIMAYYGMGPMPQWGTHEWFQWIEDLYVVDWDKIPKDWKPGDPTPHDETWVITLAAIDKAMKSVKKSSRE